jgi:RNA recognition motif-containing protein
MEEKKASETLPYIDPNKLAKKWRLIVRNVSFKVTEEQLRAIMEPLGTVIEVSLPKKPGQEHHIGFGFVQFTARSQATRAMKELTGKQLGDRVIALDYALSKDHYEKAKLEISSTKKSPPLKKAKLEISSTKKSLPLIEKKQKQPKKYVKKNVIPIVDRADELQRTVFVRNVPYDAEEEELEQM